mmetsp:Transcript_85822/g.199503  ORF Transcript_85822/g.199503 Transcript_85822/m.199503 type:complete len:213 (-) Transcript_85822:2-640(-)
MRRLAVLGLEVYFGTVGQEEFDRLHVALLSSLMQCCPPHSRLHVDVEGVALHQFAHLLEISVLGKVQECVLLFFRRHRLGPARSGGFDRRLSGSSWLGLCLFGLHDCRTAFGLFKGLPKLSLLPRGQRGIPSNVFETGQLGFHIGCDFGGDARYAAPHVRATAAKHVQQGPEPQFILLYLAFARLALRARSLRRLNSVGLHRGSTKAGALNT